MSDRPLAELSDRELDALGCEHILGFKWVKPTHGTCCTCPRCGRDFDTCMGVPCELAEHPMDVIEAMEEDGWQTRVSGHPRIGHEANFERAEPFGGGFATHLTSKGRAVLIAALRAKGVERG